MPNPNTYDVYQLSLMPTALRGPVGEARASAQGLFKDGFPEAAIAAVKCRWATTCPEDALPAIGFERLLPRSPVESTAQYRDRLQRAWDLWPFAGTRQGVITALNILGFPNVLIFENSQWTVDPSPGFVPPNPVAILGASNTAPIVINAPGHGLVNGNQPVTIAGVSINTAANGTWNKTTIIDADNISLSGSVGNGAGELGTLTPVPEWWRFWVVINQPDGFTVGWSVGDGTIVGSAPPIGFSSAPLTYPVIRPTIALWQPAHALLISIIVILSGNIVGQGWNIGDGTVVGGAIATI